MLINRIWWILYIAWVTTELWVLIVTRTRRGGGEVSDRGSLIVLWVVNFSSMFVASFVAATCVFAEVPSHNLAKPIALALLAAGLLIRWSAIRTLGRSFSANVAIHATQTLNRAGLFRYMRHPSYTGLVLIFLAMGVRSANWLALLLFVVPPVIALLYRIRVEEVALTQAFGEQYLDYSRTTKRLIPGLY